MGLSYSDYPTTTTTTTNQALARYDGTSWQAFTLPVSGSLYALSFSQPDDGWLLGYDALASRNQLYQYSAGRVISITLPLTDFNPAALYSLAPADVWLAGSGTAQLLHWNGSSWQSFSGYSATTSIQMLSPDEGWATTDGSYLLHYQHGTWQRVAADFPAQSVSMISATDGWAVGAGGLLHYRPASCHDYYYDVPPEHWAYQYVQALSCAGTVSGDGNHHLNPTVSTRRAEFAKLMVLAYNLPAYTPPQPTFSDVPASYPLYNYVEAAAHAGVVVGYQDGSFRPNQAVSRAEVAVVVARTGHYPLLTPTSPSYQDVATNYYAYGAIEGLTAAGVVNGQACSSGGGRCYRPGEQIARAELAKATYNLMQQPAAISTATSMVLPTASASPATMVRPAISPTASSTLAATAQPYPQADRAASQYR